MKKFSKLKLFEIINRCEKFANIYLCGPTVYDHVHIGNLRPVIVFDVLYRLLLHEGFEVNYVQNITDIDDKIIAKSQQQKSSEKAIALHYTESYFSVLLKYNVLFPSHLPRVSNNISEIKNFIQKLIEKKQAYQHNGEIFFKVKDNKKYGELSGQNLDQLKENEQKKTFGRLEKRDFVC